MINTVFRPLEQWPRGAMKKDWERKRSQFKASYAKTLDLLESKLNRIRAKDIVIQAQFEFRDIRNDGWPRSSARPRGPAVVLTFTKDKDVISMPCDTFNAWEDNLRAIALSLEALRRVVAFQRLNQMNQVLMAYHEKKGAAA